MNVSQASKIPHARDKMGAIKKHVIFQHNSFEYDHLITEVSLKFQYFIEPRGIRRKKTGYDHIRPYTSRSHHPYRTEVYLDQLARLGELFKAWYLIKIAGMWKSHGLVVKHGGLSR